jgi:predicted metalloprotease with PDZ domain
MTKATFKQQQKTREIKPTIAYQVAMPQPNYHLFEVNLQIDNWQEPVLNLKMPVWTPGSYLVREYARHIQNFKLQGSQNNQNLFSQKIQKNHWQINTERVNYLRVIYQVFANELTVRTNHLDATHGYFNGAALFLYIPDLEHLPITVKIIPPRADWHVSTSLPSLKGEKNIFYAENFDTLVDSPFEIGTHNIYNFEVLNKPHQWAIWGRGNAEVEKIIKDTEKIITTQAELYGGLPYQNYLFLLHLSASGFGGLEHKNCCSLNYPRFEFKNKEKYNRFMQLVAHEFFHLWNVKRIRPKALEKFNYDGENYTTSLWFSEGTTSYYDMLIPLRAKVYDRSSFLEILSKDITKYLNTPGRKLQPLSESSFDAWIKLYRRDAYSDNSQISYYLKGELVSLLLDLLIRKRHQNRRSLDDVMLQMWHKFGKDEIGYTPEELQAVMAEVAAIDLTDFFTRYLNTTEELPFNEYLQPFGLELKPITEEDTPPYLGINVQSEGGKETIAFVAADSPAAVAGIDAGDELLALDGIRVTGEQLSDRLKDYQAGDIISLSIFHEEQLRSVEVTLQPPQPLRYEVKEIHTATPAQKTMLDGWLVP